MLTSLRDATFIRDALDEVDMEEHCNSTFHIKKQLHDFLLFKISAGFNIVSPPQKMRPLSQKHQFGLCKPCTRINAKSGDGFLKRPQWYHNNGQDNTKLVKVAIKVAFAKVPFT